MFLVQNRANRKHYAMKVMNKNDDNVKSEIRHIQNERMVLEKLKHPFLVRFYQAFQTKTKLHLVLEFANGGDLYSQLNTRSKFTEECARFYAAEIVLALEYLHDNNIIYRGLKPEEVLLDVNGHIKLSDFGLAKDENTSSATFCGSPLYLAPEVITGKRQTKAIDWWSLGVLIYEMLCGEPPFWDDDGKKLLKAILEDSVTFKSNVSPDAQDLIKSLLEANPDKRLGSSGVSEIKKHPFFKGINWSDIYTKQVRPPFVPLVRSESDTGNVDFLFTSGALKKSFKDNFKTS